MFFWNSLKLRSMCALIRPTGCPSRHARKYCASACAKNGFFFGSSRFLASISSGGTQLGSPRYSRHGSLINALSSRRFVTGLTSTAITARTLYVRCPPSVALVGGRAMVFR